MEVDPAGDRGLVVHTKRMAVSWRGCRLRCSRAEITGPADFFRRDEHRQPDARAAPCPADALPSSVSRQGTARNNHSIGFSRDGVPFREIRETHGKDAQRPEILCRIAASASLKRIFVMIGSNLARGTPACGAAMHVSAPIRHTAATCGTQTARSPHPTVRQTVSPRRSTMHPNEGRAPGRIAVVGRLPN
jgi:hypothetical protein